MSITMEKVTGAWATWATSFLAAPVSEMSVQDSAIFASCLMNETNEGFPGEKITSSFPYKLLAKRAAVLDMGLDLGVDTFLSVSCGNPGTLVMYICALKFAMRKHNPGVDGFDQVTMQHLASAFPNGFIKGSELERLWDSQKGRAFGLDCDNMLDYLTASLAIAPGQEPVAKSA